jgi:hypothetical protein
MPEDDVPHSGDVCFLRPLWFENDHALRFSVGWQCYSIAHAGRNCFNTKQFGIFNVPSQLGVMMECNSLNYAPRHSSAAR